MKNKLGFLIAICLGCLILGVGMRHEKAQITMPATTGMVAPIARGAGTPSATLVCNAASANLLYWQTATVNLWICDGTSTWNQLAGAASGGGFQSQDFQLTPGLFATNTAVANIYYELNAVSIKAIVTREQGSPVCTAAPVLVVLDLGTSASTAYGSATVLTSQTLSTSNTVVATTGLNLAVAAGHFVGIGFSAGTCVTPPTINATLVLQ